MKISRALAGHSLFLGLLLLTGGCDSSQVVRPQVSLPSGLEFQDLVIGYGSAVTRGAILTVDYVGRFPDGTEFGNTERKPFKSVWARSSRVGMREYPACEWAESDAWSFHRNWRTGL
jgi:hypothetical protein